MLTIDTDKPYKIYAEVAEESALAQFRTAMAQPFVLRGAWMADGHTGYSLPIGGVVATKDVVVPAYVGFDVGCGVGALRTTFKLADVRRHGVKILERMMATIPVGKGKHNATAAVWPGEREVPRTARMQAIFDKFNGFHQLGSVGDGNHFIEVGADEDKQIWIAVHSGSRGVGWNMADAYMKLAAGEGRSRAECESGHFPLEIDSPLGRDYLIDQDYCLAFALENRRQLLLRAEAAIAKFCKGEAHWGELINRNHNHMDRRGDLLIHRKGATHAEEGMLGVIPGNREDGFFIVRGKGNPDALWSSSHGAGRVKSRTQAAKLDPVAERAALKRAGVIAHESNGLLEESKRAYKDIFEVMRLQADLVDTLAHVRPIINVKG